jgi:hypothetical protein
MHYPHWEFFMALDSDLDDASRYVEISPDNFKTYSIEFVHLLLAAGSEIDVVAKELCKKIEPSGNPSKITDYREIITRAYPKFHTIEISAPRHGITLRPWTSWGIGCNPDWWQWYNKVKHERHLFYMEANLENVLGSISALFGIILYLYQPELYALELASWPKVLSIPTFHWSVVSGSGEIKLPDF